MYLTVVRRIHGRATFAEIATHQVVYRKGTKVVEWKRLGADCRPVLMS